MTNWRQFEIALLANKVDNKQIIANLLGISLPSLYSKINNDTDFKASEIYKIAEFLKLNADDVNLIFFDGMLPKGQQNKEE